MTDKPKKRAARKTSPAKTKRATPKPRPKKKTVPTLADIAVAALEDMKAVNIKVLDVRKMTHVTDVMIVASGTSDRHVKSIANRVVERCQKAGHRLLGLEGDREGEWILVDLQDVIVHVMLTRIREFYGLEKLWDARPGQHNSSAD